jgi:hypothetical protein
MPISKEAIEQARSNGRPMKEAELREYARCACCNRLVGESGVPLFWKVTIERYGMDVQAMTRQNALARIVGNPRIANALGPDEDMAHAMMPPHVLAVCETCGVGSNLPIAVLSELPGVVLKK